MNERQRGAAALGQAAALEGRPLAACPFEWRSIESVAWEEGWRAVSDVEGSRPWLSPRAAVPPCSPKPRGAVSGSGSSTELQPEG